MSDFVPNDKSVASTSAQERRLPGVSRWLKELPYGVVLVLTLIGVAYTSFAKRPTTAYWEFLVPVTGALCIWSGWRSAREKNEELRLIWTQGRALARLLCRHESPVATQRASHGECRCNWARCSSLAGSRHLCCRCAHSGVASLHARGRHGAFRAGDRVDREGRADHPARRNCPGWSGNDVLVDRAQKAGVTSSVT